MFYWLALVAAAFALLPAVASATGERWPFSVLGLVGLFLIGIFFAAAIVALAGRAPPAASGDVPAPRGDPRRAWWDTAEFYVVGCALLIAWTGVMWFASAPPQSRQRRP